MNQMDANQHFSAQIGVNASKLQQQQAALQRGTQQVPVGQGLVNPQGMLNFQYYQNTQGYFPQPTAPPTGP
jgi:hypothetical protein